MGPDLARRCLAEFVGTAFLLAGVVGSGIMAERLTDDVGLQLFINAFATAGMLFALIVTFAATSGAHFNPAVSLAERGFGTIDTPALGGYVLAQVLGGALGVVVANLMFDLPAVEWSTTDRSSANLLISEAVATAGLLLVIAGVGRGMQSTVRVPAIAAAVAGYIGGAYFFTSSTSFANPAVTLSRTLSDTFAGIEPASVPGFVAVQLIATVLTVGLINVIFRDPAPR